MPHFSKLLRPPRVVRLLSQHGGNALKMDVQKGRYVSPMVPKRHAKALRKQSIVEGTFGSFTPLEGGWNPQWDVPQQFYGLRPHRGHLRERTRQRRFDKIEDAMKAMPDKIDKYKQEVDSRKPKKDIFYQFKRVAAIARKRGKLGGREAATQNKKVNAKNAMKKKKK